MTRKTPQQKKALSYEKDRRNCYGENSKSSRKNIPKRKTHNRRAYRHKVTQTLAGIQGDVPPEELEPTEAAAKSVRREVWEKHPDQPLADHLVGQAVRRVKRENKKVLARKPSRFTSMKRWKELQERLVDVVAPTVPFKIHIEAYSMQASCVAISSHCIIAVGDTIIWDYPCVFHEDCTNPDTGAIDAHAIVAVVQQWLDTPSSRLLATQYPEDEWGLTEILLAVDRRMGRRRLQSLKRRTRSAHVKSILAARLGCTAHSA